MDTTQNTPRQLGFRPLLSAAIVSFLLVGCQSASPQPTISYAPVIPSPASPTPSEVTADSPPSFSPELQPIYQGLVNYWTVLDKLSRDPTSDITELAHVTIGTGETLMRRQLIGMRDRGTKRGATPVYRNVQIEAPTTENGETQATVNYCIDLKDMVLLHADTGQVKDTPRRPKAIRESLIMELQSNGAWLMASVNDEVIATC